MNSRQLGTTVAIVAMGAVGGAAAAWQPVWFIAAAIGLTIVALPLTGRLVRMSVPNRAAALLIAIHICYLMRHTWLDVDYFPAFYYIRLPVLLIFPLVGILGGFASVFRSPVRRIGGIALLYGTWMVVVGQWGIDPGRTLFYGSWLLLLILNLTMAVALSDNPRDLWWTWLRGLGIIGVICCIGCILAIGTGGEIVRADRWIKGVLQPSYRGLFWSQNVMGAQGIVTMAAFLAARPLFPERRTPWLPAVLVIAGIVVVASTSRACLLGYIIGLGIYALQRTKSRSIGRQMILIVGIALLGILVATTTNLASSSLDRLKGTASSLESGEEGRLHIWKTYINRTIDHPIVGSGFINSPFQEDYVALRNARSFHSPHSFLIQYIVVPGIPAGLLFSYLLFMVGQRLRGWRRDPLRGSIVHFVAILSPIFLGSAATGPRSWGALLLWLPLILVGSLPILSPEGSDREPPAAKAGAATDP